MILGRTAVSPSAWGMLMAIPVVVVPTIYALSSSGGRTERTKQQRSRLIKHRPVGGCPQRREPLTGMICCEGTAKPCLPKRRPGAGYGGSASEGS